MRSDRADFFKRFVWLAVVLMPCFLVHDFSYGQEKQCPLIGAFRWDSWHGMDSKIGEAVERTLGPKEWHYRVPFCGEILSENRVKIECDTQEAINKEIVSASSAGLNFWAFDFYGKENPMSRVLHLYLQSSRKSHMKFAINIMFPHSGFLKSDVPYIYDLMKDNDYIKTNISRPLLFIYSIQQDVVDKEWGGAKEVRDFFVRFRDGAIKRGIGNPYIVVLDFNPERAKKWVDLYGFDAISTYATHARGKGAPYRDLVRHTENYWKRSRKTGAKVVPIVMAGWNPRPRVSTPLPWTKKKDESWYHEPQPSELTTHLRSAIDWSKANYGANALIIIYAWNECIEGGCIVPSLLKNDLYLRAIRDAIPKECRAMK